MTIDERIAGHSLVLSQNLFYHFLGFEFQKVNQSIYWSLLDQEVKVHLSSTQI